jgi:hypothetical protein
VADFNVTFDRLQIIGNEHRRKPLLHTNILQSNTSYLHQESFPHTQFAERNGAFCSSHQTLAVCGLIANANWSERREKNDYFEQGGLCAEETFHAGYCVS